MCWSETFECPMSSVECAQASEIKPLQVDDIPNCATNDQLILELVTDDEADLDQLAIFIEESPSLVAMIIGLANSAYFSAPMQIFTVSDAIIKVLGMRMVRSIVLSVILGRSLDLSRCDNFKPAEYWADALTVGRYCQILTANSDFKKLVSIDQIYLSALLSNFGSLVLVHHYPREMNDIFEVDDDPLVERLSRQRTRLGMDQAAAGLLLGRAWSLPSMVVNTMHHCHDGTYQGQDWAVCRLIGEVSELVNQVNQGNEDLKLSPQVEKILGLKSSDCRLDEISELRQELLIVAKHLAVN